VLAAHPVSPDDRTEREVRTVAVVKPGPVPEGWHEAAGTRFR